MNQSIPTPDFESYSMAVPLKGALVKGDTVHVQWVDGYETSFHHFWLRDNCACTYCIDANSRERVNSILLIPDDVHPSSVSVSQDGGLVVAWAQPVGECVTSHFHPGWLRARDYAGGVRPVAEWPVETWDRSLEKNLPIFPADDVFHDEDVRYSFLTTVQRLGLAIITGMSKEYEAFERMASQIGLLRDMNWGKIFEIVADPKGEYIANRGIALDAHSDASTREYIPGFQIFQCVQNSSQGGESFWVDGFHIAALLEQEYPEQYHLLTSVPWEFANRSRNSHYRWNAPILELDRWGKLTSVRDTTWLREPLCIDFDLVPKLYDAYRTFARLKAARENQVEHKLVEGEVSFVDNRRTLHGRRAYDPSSGIRHIRTSYGEREELLSSIRMIERARRACANGVTGQ